MPRHAIPSLVLATVITASTLITVTVLTGFKAIPGWDVGTRGIWTGRADDPWRLRTSDHGVTSGASASAVHLRVAEEIPDERRAVRVVYPALTGSR